jgi:hypothetical protein
LVKNNKIDEAIEKLKQFELPDKNPQREEELIFSLLCLKVVNLMRDLAFDEAVDIARDELVPLAGEKVALPLV